MSNIDLYHQEAIKALNAGSLNEKQKQFIERIKDFDKKQLKKLSANDFKWLKDIGRLNIKKAQSTETPSQAEPGKTEETTPKQ
ncbi:MAG: hypothetical protein P0Y53_09835 [Candidatus Pseudobacter hemicellulosilyticus]|uniref:Uncharacterized protein n=1 Tax=Candidatus Pseudobacter hemicellulosilyticus TaxID=3121375 RepID=A0AAJ5WY91_9BACT|nr:MAG: hypothetical protein P0Y53_09835 [Pseudobacter sp.]